MKKLSNSVADNFNRAWTGGKNALKNAFVELGKKVDGKEGGITATKAIGTAVLGIALMGIATKMGDPALGNVGGALLGALPVLTGVDITALNAASEKARGE